MKEIFIAIGVVAAVGFAAGLLLAIVSRFFGVKEDERTKSIRACLPGANCGACGYKGCDDYASALASGNASPNLCVPGGEDTARALGEVLGVKAEAKESRVAFVHCNGYCEATSNKAEYEGYSSCRAASMIYGGPGACRYGCLGFGECAAVCPVGAICVKDGIAHVDTKLCIGCGLCAKACPRSVISLVPRNAATVVMCNNKDKGADARRACTNACIACTKCQKICPAYAVEVKDNLARIDYEKCVGCRLCAEDCPVKCIHLVEFDK